MMEMCALGVALNILNMQFSTHTFNGIMIKIPIGLFFFKSLNVLI